MKKITLKAIQAMTKSNIPIACLTAYDASIAKYIDECGIDIILVGDSLGEVIQGANNTHKVTMADMEYHTKIVSAGRKNAYLVSDMPKNSFKDTKSAIVNARKLLSNGAEMIKLEASISDINTIEGLVKNNIPVCAHIGIQPQNIKLKSQYKKKGKTKSEKIKLLNESLLFQEAGADLIILECIDEKLAQIISEKLHIPVIGIASGRFCTGQILVTYDLLGISFNGLPKFINKKYLSIPSSEERIIKFIEITKESLG